MASGGWVPRPELLEEVLGLLGAGLSPDSARQRRAREQLEALRPDPEFARYLLCVLTGDESEGERVIAGALLKRVVDLDWGAWPEDVRADVREGLLAAIARAPPAARRAAVNAAGSIARRAGLRDWPAFVPFVVDALVRADDEASVRGAMDLAVGVCEDVPDDVTSLYTPDQVTRVAPLLLERAVCFSSHPDEVLRTRALQILDALLERLPGPDFETLLPRLLGVLAERAEDPYPAVRALVCRILATLATTATDAILPLPDGLVDFIGRVLRPDPDADADEAHPAFAACQFCEALFAEAALRGDAHMEQVRPFALAVLPHLCGRTIRTDEDLDEDSAPLLDVDDAREPDDPRLVHPGWRRFQRLPGRRIDESEARSEGESPRGEGADDASPSLASEDDASGGAPANATALYKAAARALDRCAVVFGSSILREAAGWISASLEGNDPRDPAWRVRNAALLVLGALVSGIDEMESIHGLIVDWVPRVAELAHDARPIVRATALWCLNRIVASWAWTETIVASEDSRGGASASSSSSSSSLSSSLSSSSLPPSSPSHSTSSRHHQHHRDPQRVPSLHDVAAFAVQTIAKATQDHTKFVQFVALSTLSEWCRTARSYAPDLAPAAFDTVAAAASRFQLRSFLAALDALAALAEVGEGHWSPRIIEEHVLPFLRVVDDRWGGMVRGAFADEGPDAGLSPTGPGDPADPVREHTLHSLLILTRSIGVGLLPYADVLLRRCTAVVHFDLEAVHEAAALGLPPPDLYSAACALATIAAIVEWEPDLPDHRDHGVALSFSADAQLPLSRDGRGSASSFGAPTSEPHRRSGSSSPSSSSSSSSFPSSSTSPSASSPFPSGGVGSTPPRRAGSVGRGVSPGSLVARAVASAPGAVDRALELGAWDLLTEGLRCFHIDVRLASLDGIEVLCRKRDPRALGDAFGPLFAEVVRCMDPRVPKLAGQASWIMVTWVERFGLELGPIIAPLIDAIHFIFSGPHAPFGLVDHVASILSTLFLLRPEMIEDEGIEGIVGAWVDVITRTSRNARRLTIHIRALIQVAERRSRLVHPNWIAHLVSACAQLRGPTTAELQDAVEHFSGLLQRTLGDEVWYAMLVQSPARFQLTALFLAGRGGGDWRDLQFSPDTMRDAAGAWRELIADYRPPWGDPAG